MALDNQTYHTLIPIIDSQDEYVGAIDVGYAKAFQDAAIKGFLEKILWSSIAANDELFAGDGGSRLNDFDR